MIIVREGLCFAGGSRGSGFLVPTELGRGKFILPAVGYLANSAWKAKVLGLFPATIGAAHGGRR